MRFLRAFAWLRWRLLANGLRAAERRDMVERVSRVTALIAPGFLLATSISSVVACTALGAMGGWLSVTNGLQTAGVLPTIRVFLLLATVFAAFVPLFVGMHGGTARVARLLLLPISQRMLHFVEVVTSLTDPWVIFVLPGLVGYAGAMIVAALIQPESWLRDRAFVGLVALVAAVGMAFVLASLSALVAFLVNWIVRDRRRSEVFVVLVVFGLSVVSIVPAVMSSRFSRSDQLGSLDRLPPWAIVLPSELYGEAVVRAAGGHSVWLPLGALFLEGAILYVLSARVHRRLVESVEGGRTPRNRTLNGAALSPRIPGLWPGTSAVAIAQTRTALRSVRGRLVVLLPGPLAGMFAVVFRNIHGASGVEVIFGYHGYLALGMGIIIGLYAAQPFTMNQFGSDRAGLTLQFLAPIRDVDLVKGKAAGCAVIIGAGVLVTLACVLLAAPGGSPFFWLATLAGGVATYLVLSPVAAWFSVLLPVAADLSKTGTGGNPHSLAMLAGMVFVAVAATPAAVILLTLSPLTAFLSMAVWMGVAWAMTLPLLSLAARSLKARRENLALIAQSR
jgi:hypothetical protein